MKPSSQELYHGKVVHLRLETHTLPDGRQGRFEILRHSGAAAAVPVLDDGRIILIRQFRPTAAELVWEIPAGRLEPGEAPEACAERELMEEIGLRPGRLEKLGEMHPALGYSDEKLHLFIARELTPATRAGDDDEYIEPVTLPLGEAVAMVLDGTITDSKTQVALLLAEKRLGGR